MDNTTPRALGFPLPEIHAIDASVFADGRYLCLRCKRMVDAERWARPCPGLVAFDHLFPDSQAGIDAGIAGVTDAASPSASRSGDVSGHTAYASGTLPKGSMKSPAREHFIPEPGVVDGVRGRAVNPATERAIDAPSHEANQ